MHHQSYKERYDRFKAAVDQDMGRTLGTWGKIKAFFAPNAGISDARKAAIERAHADALYQPHNIIGKTEAHGQLPTIYYRSRSGTVGHITQEHPRLDNVGREKVIGHPNYTFGNTGKGGNLQEKIGSRVIHTSRNAFQALDANTRKPYENVHQNFPNIKSRYGI